METEKTQLIIDKVKSANLSLLVVEDDEVSQHIITTLLNMLNVRFDLASNGQQALDLTKNNKYDLILLDCHLPIIDGYQTAIKIRERESLEGQRPTKIFAISTIGSAENRAECLKSGMDQFISKPIRFALLLDILDQIC